MFPPFQQVARCRGAASAALRGNLPHSMVLIRGLDRLPNTAQENLSDADWAVHSRFLQSEFEAEGRRREAAGLAPTSFEEFAAPFADRPFNRELHEQVLALREQADALRRIANSASNVVETMEEDEEDADGPSLVSNIEEMTYDAGPLDSCAPKRRRHSWPKRVSSKTAAVAATVGVLAVLIALLYAE